MLIRTLLLALLLMLPAAVTQAAEVDRKAGVANLQEAGAFDDDKIQLLELKADGVTVTAKLRFDDFFDKMIINANANVHNTNDKAKFYYYYIAFFDADGNLLGCTGMGSFGDKGFGAGEKTQLGSCLIPLDKADRKKVKTFKATLYVSDKEIGKG